MIRDLALMALGCLPPSRFKNLLLSQVPGVTVAPTAVIRPCLIVRVSALEVEDRARIGAGCVIWNMHRVTVGCAATIGQWNWISSDPRLTRAYPGELTGTFSLDSDGAVTSRHHIDCSGGVRMGSFSILAGHRSSVLSHSVDIWQAVQRVAPVHVGKYCFIGAGCIITSGVSIADNVVVGAGSVVVRSLEEQYKLYAGSPARVQRDVQGAEYFTRLEGPVCPASAVEERAPGDPS